MRTFHIHIEGQVQGVGFRPFVYRLAKANGLKGTVSNGVDGVHIYFNCDEKGARQFLRNILDNLPQRARVLKYGLENGSCDEFTDFSIIESRREGTANLLVTPDLGICEDCRSELLDPSNRRFHYPFITCINCGPRYSIMHELPYDRDKTSMDPFTMCRPCLEEYNSPLTRRHYSQTNSCPACPVRLFWYEKAGNTFVLHEGQPAESYIENVVVKLSEGKIIAIKGIGGYLLICDATNQNAVKELRLRKKRPSKPFALMYPDLDSLSSDVHLNEKEADAFQSIESPIVLCRLKKDNLSGICINEIAPGLDKVGAMQPYTPLFELILRKWKKPIVATSGNLSGSPIFFDDKKALRSLAPYVDAFLTNDRDILIPQDDSVVQYTPVAKKRIVLRRSRGFAPTFIYKGFREWNSRALAMGADLKSTFALQHAGNTYVSQYLGDLESYDTQENYLLTLNHFLRLFDTRPDQIIIDKHPGYFSALEGKRLASEWKIPLIQVQHHEAHFAAVLAENELLESQKPVMGVVWDGTGWGEDSIIYGGEFFVFEAGKIQRISHLPYYPHILGDKMSKEPRLSALAICRGVPEAENLIKQMFSEQEWTYYSKKVHHSGSLLTSSMGRLFDGVAALLGLISKASFEGEAAMRLEALASTFGGKPKAHYYPVNPVELVKAIANDLQAGVQRNEIAFRFHDSLVKWIASVAKKHRIRRLAFSGGVFQNALLTDLIIQHLNDDFRLYFHRELSPNDESISFGQLAHVYLMNNRDQKN